MRNVLVNTIRRRGLECTVLRDKVNASRRAAISSISADERTGHLVSMALVNKQANDLDAHISDLRDQLIREYGG
ncbi:hypothetical protein [Achromobacter xylosoxidans]|uniref:Uncharacterized protein n=1 Tax=Alcaligenes xylosoxydans xylosoxydans TaxID=85698 RepID=A0A424W541_ALCXX|nr:hypothetical protein [Achromobacter xylosoxidans]MBC9904788.1 hypothetical protein [Achromobacter xylosoxidans]MBD0868705.1 hypothetical protein [Achromobacter xylosoxidans]QNP87792.1 hypothetical protein IAG39_09900 [Achromobacter xylosoxidans]RPJ88433.1 hypothetical protein DY367_27895 [Achromobacter xylosoxidans]